MFDPDKFYFWLIHSIFNSLKQTFSIRFPLTFFNIRNGILAIIQQPWLYKVVHTHIGKSNAMHAPFQNNVVQPIVLEIFHCWCYHIFLNLDAIINFEVYPLHLDCLLLQIFIAMLYFWAVIKLLSIQDRILWYSSYK